MDGTFGTSLQLGANAGESLAVSVKNMSTTSLGNASGATASTAVTSASFQGAEATKTVTKMTFNGNDTYNFALTLGGLGESGDTYTFNISGDVASGSAKDIVDKINAALRATPVGMYDSSATAPAATTTPVASAADSIRATFVGNTVTIENLTGSTVKVDAGSATYTAGTPNTLTFAGQISDTGSTVSFTSVTSGDVKTLASGNYNATSLINQGPATVSTTGGTAAVASTIEIGMYALAGDDVSANALDYTLTDQDRIHLELVSGSQTVSLDTGSLAASDASTLAEVVAELNVALSNSGNSDYTITAGSTGILITRADGQDFSVKQGANNDLTTAGDDVYFIKVNGELKAGAATARSFDASGTAKVVVAMNDTSVAATDTTTTNHLAAGDQFKFTLTDVASGATVVVDTGAIDGAGANVTATEIAAAMQTAIDNAGATGYAVTASGQEFTIARSDGNEFTFKMEPSSVTGATFASTATFNEAQTSWDLKATGDTIVANNGTVAVPGTSTTPESKSIMYLDILAEDTFSLKGAGIDGAGAITAATSGVSFEYTGTASSLALAASRIKAELNAITQTGKTFNFQTEVVDGRIKITENNGNKFAITGFTSTGSGRIAASVPSEQAASASASAVLLDDATYASTASTSAAGSVVVTDVDMHFGAADDKYSFSISDGTATAAVSVTSVAGYDATPADNGDGTDILAAINVALDQAGMSDTVTANVSAVAATGSPETGAVITLQHKLGYELTIADFSSVGNQTVKVVAGANDTTGVAKFLDDNGGGATGATVSTISAATSSLAADAIDVIDNALSAVNAERANLGSVQNRLGHTINNLSNISVNTSAAQSRIEDADYGIEAANLAKAQVMQQAGTAMLAQANAMQQTVLSLLQ